MDGLPSCDAPCYTSWKIPCHSASVPHATCGWDVPPVIQSRLLEMVAFRNSPGIWPECDACKNGMLLVWGSDKIWFMWAFCLDFHSFRWEQTWGHDFSKSCFTFSQSAKSKAWCKQNLMWSSPLNIRQGCWSCGGAKSHTHCIPAPGLAGENSTHSEQFSWPAAVELPWWTGWGDRLHLYTLWCYF